MKNEKCREALLVYGPLLHGALNRSPHISKHFHDKYYVIVNCHSLLNEYNTDFEGLPLSAWHSKLSGPLFWLI